jgi:hypothetical protein
MSATTALKAAHAAGVELAIDGDDLVLEAASEPPAAVLGALSKHKAEIVALLRPGRDGWSAEDWQAFFDERAGIAEFDHGLLRDKAEAQAFTRCVVEWLNHHPPPCAPGRCAGCGKPETPFAMVLPFGAGEHHAWLHADCWPAWHQSRQAEAATVLRKMGIAPGGS